MVSPVPPPGRRRDRRLDRRRPRLKAVVDTNVVAYYLLGTPRFANVVWMAVRTGVLPVKDSLGKLRLAVRIGVQAMSIRALWGDAFPRSLESGVAVYDTLFVELASRERVRFATFDQKLVKAYPDVACRPGAIAP